MEDNDIIELYWQRSEQAIYETSNKYGNALFMLADGILHNVEDSEECVNDTYHIAWTTIPPKKPEYFFAYLAKIARHFAFGRLDYKNAKKRNALVVELGEELENCLPAPDDYERKMESEEIGKVISQFLRTQKELIRNVFISRYWYMNSVRQISEEFHISESKVKSILFRTRNRLRKYLESEGIIL